MLIKEHSSFVELNRRFRKLETKAKAEEAAVESYTANPPWQISGLSWDELLKENRAVILGEPGSGKSWELRERTRLLNSKGEYAFFVRLDQLIERELPQLLDEDEKSRFQRWKRSGNAAYFFLDSVDEAKFRRISDFHATLLRFRNEIGPTLILRAKVFLSSRISEWKPFTDGFEFQRLFPLPPVERRTGENISKAVDQTKPEFLAVQLEPLVREQVELIAEMNGVSNVQGFTLALDQAFAWEFARRPLDVSDLIRFWNEHARIGSLTELIDFDISSKLRPREGRDEHNLSEAEGREGAEWLAAASVFSRKFSFAVPDDGSSDVDSLNPRGCLPSNWRDDQMRALLNRAIFDSAVYGHFRFHHRRIGEYLAAKWIAVRMENGCPQHVLEHLLIEVVRGRKVLRPSLRPVAAWLCCGSNQWNELARKLVIETGPGIHLQYGDPAGISVDYRRQVLFALSQVSRKRKRMWIESSPDCLARLADSALSADIAHLIRDRGLADDFRIELLDIVRLGRLAACIDAAMTIVKSRDEHVNLKSHAVSAIGAVDDSTRHNQLFLAVYQHERIPNRLCNSVIQALYPQSISSEQLVQLLAKTEDVREFHVDMPFYLSSHIETVITRIDAGDLLKRLVVLAQTPPLVRHGDRTLPVSIKFYWLGNVIATVLGQLLRKASLSDEETAVATQSLLLLGHIRECHHCGREDYGE